MLGRPRCTRQSEAGMEIFGTAAVVSLMMGLGGFHAGEGCSGGIDLPGGEPNEAVVIVDGELYSVGVTSLDEVPVQRIEISCWSPETGEFTHNHSGPPTRTIGVVFVTTKAFEESGETLAGLYTKARKVMQDLWDERTKAEGDGGAR